MICAPNRFTLHTQYSLPPFPTVSRRVNSNAVSLFNSFYCVQFAFIIRQISYRINVSDHNLKLYTTYNHGNHTTLTSK